MTRSFPGPRRAPDTTRGATARRHSLLGGSENPGHDGLGFATYRSRGGPRFAGDEYRHIHDSVPRYGCAEGCVEPAGDPGREDGALHGDRLQYRPQLPKFGIVSEFPKQ